MDAKRQLAGTFQSIMADVFDDPETWERLLEWADTFPGSKLPGASRKLTSLGRTHRLIFSYLLSREDSGADNEVLRVLTGDAVHTERRLRELREAGLKIAAAKRGGTSVYVLDRSALPWRS
jgi:hypothetical protein